MELNRKQLKLDARAVMRESHPRPILVTLVYLLLTSGLSAIVGLFATNPMTKYLEYIQMGYSEDIAMYYAFAGSGMGLSLFLSILIGLFTMVLGIGYAAWALRRSRGEDAGYGTLLTGFSMAGRVIGLNLFIGLFSMLWSFAVMIPAALVIGVVAAALAESAMGVAVFLIVVVYVAAFVLLISIVLRYSMADYALLDAPEAGIRVAVNRSKELMKGRRWFYVVMHLSFIGWYLLIGLLALVGMMIGAVIVGGAAGLSWSAFAFAAATGGTVATILGFVLPLIMEVWLVPYVQITDANFYDAAIAADRQKAQPSFPEL